MPMARSFLFHSQLTRKNRYYLGAFRLFFALVLLVFAGLPFYNPFNNEEGYTRTKATVIESRHISGGGDNPHLYIPTLTYEVDGREYTAKSGMIAKESPYKIGSTVEITYKNSDPSSSRQMNQPKVMSTAIALGIGLVGLMLAARTIRQMYNAP